MESWVKVGILSIALDIEARYHLPCLTFCAIEFTLSDASISRYYSTCSLFFCKNTFNSFLKIAGINFSKLTVAFLAVASFIVAKVHCSDDAGDDQSAGSIAGLPFRKQFSDREIVQLIDKKVTRELEDGSIVPEKSKEARWDAYQHRIAEMKASIAQFDGELAQLPFELAKQASEYPTRSHPPKSLAAKVDAFFQKKRFYESLKMLPEDLAKKASQYGSFGKLPKEVAEEVNWHLVNQRFDGLLGRIPEDLAKEVAALKEGADIPEELSRRIYNYFDKKHSRQ